MAVSAALDQPGVQEFVADAGFDDFVCLPVEVETIVERIEAVTTGRASAGP